MSVNAAAGHITRAQMPQITAFVSAKPDQPRSHSVAPQAPQSAFVAAGSAASAAGAPAAGGTLDIKL